jgi:hypothetical protein
MVTTVTIKDRTPVSVPVSTSASDPSEVVRLPALVLVLAAFHRHMVMVVSPYPYDIFNPSTAMEMEMGLVVSTTVVVSTVATVAVEALYQYSCLRPPYYYWRVSISRCICRVMILIMVIICIVLLGADDHILIVIMTIMIMKIKPTLMMIVTMTNLINGHGPVDCSDCRVFRLN